MQRSGRRVEMGGPMPWGADGSVGRPAVDELFDDVQLSDVQMVDGAPRA